jgi:hypothetical protein
MARPPAAEGAPRAEHDEARLEHRRRQHLPYIYHDIFSAIMQPRYSLLKIRNCVQS